MPIVTRELYIPIFAGKSMLDQFTGRGQREGSLLCTIEAPQMDKAASSEDMAHALGEENLAGIRVLLSPDITYNKHFHWYFETGQAEQSFPGKEDACPTSWMGVRTSGRSAAPLCGSPSLNLRTIADSKCPGQKMINAASCAIECDEHDKISPYVHSAAEAQPQVMDLRGLIVLRRLYVRHDKAIVCMAEDDGLTDNLPDIIRRGIGLLH
ncbi:hypothetical protein BC629DRAFT_1637232 [Irpex lacteus]|nr:hypothetical protein BC629DRAFT_1637232 [Irpex lacteus]